MKKVIYISPNILSRKTADIVCIIEMCNAFSKRGYDTTLCVPKFGLNKQNLFEYYDVEHSFNIFEIDVPKVPTMFRISGRGLLFALLASKTLYKMRTTQFYIRDPWTFFIISVVYKRKCFFEAHQFRYEGFLQTFIYHVLVKCGVRSGNGRIVNISKSLLEQWGKHGIDKNKMFVAHDSVNINKFHKNIPKQLARSKLGIDVEKPIVVYTGSLNPSKGVDVLVKCANRLNGITFIIVGGQQVEVAKLSKLAKNKNVIFTGHVSPSEVPIYQAAADVLALPNTKGSIIDDVTSPMKLFEYIASEKPIVATNMPSILEILTHNYNALISPASDDSKFAENIETLIQNKNLAEFLTKNARKDLEGYSWDARVKYISKLFEDFK
jgi:glycosyltransferase involved in cell wall biosynthesis